MDRALDALPRLGETFERLGLAYARARPREVEAHTAKRFEAGAAAQIPEVSFLFEEGASDEASSGNAAGENTPESAGASGSSSGGSEGGSAPGLTLKPILDALRACARGDPDPAAVLAVHLEGNPGKAPKLVLSGANAWRKVEAEQPKAAEQPKTGNRLEAARARRLGALASIYREEARRAAEASASVVVADDGAPPSKAGPPRKSVVSLKTLKLIRCCAGRPKKRDVRRGEAVEAEQVGAPQVVGAAWGAVEEAEDPLVALILDVEEDLLIDAIAPDARRLLKHEVVTCAPGAAAPSPDSNSPKPPPRPLAHAGLPDGLCEAVAAARAARAERRCAAFEALVLGPSGEDGGYSKIAVLRAAGDLPPELEPCWARLWESKANRGFAAGDVVAMAALAKTRGGKLPSMAGAPLFRAESGAARRVEQLCLLEPGSTADSGTSAPREVREKALGVEVWLARHPALAARARMVERWVAAQTAPNKAAAVAARNASDHGLSALAPWAKAAAGASAPALPPPEELETWYQKRAVDWVCPGCTQEFETASKMYAHTGMNRCGKC